MPLEEIVRRLLEVIHPHGSALVTARNFILDRGFEPPVISDDWWLDVIEGSGQQDDHRWNFPIWRMTSEDSPRGESLAWIVMQHLWQSEAEESAITQLTHPSVVLDFISRQPGLREISEAMPHILVQFAPQLSIPGLGGFLERTIQCAYDKSLEEHRQKRAGNDPTGSALTASGFCPLCDEVYALRHPAFCEYTPAMVACNYFSGSSYIGPSPNIRSYDNFANALWLLSTKSAWLPARVHAYLLVGMKEWHGWANFGEMLENPKVPYESTFMLWLFDDSRKPEDTPPASILDDLRERISCGRALLQLPETVDELMAGFFANQFIEAWHQQNRRRKRARRGINK